MLFRIIMLGPTFPSSSTLNWMVMVILMILVSPGFPQEKMELVMFEVEELEDAKAHQKQLVKCVDSYC